MRVVIDGNSIRSEAELHSQLSDKLDFGPYYGRNLDALWDRLYRDVERPVELVWENSDISKKNLGAERFGKISRLLNEVMEGDSSRPPGARFTVRFE